jgi:hypothetical protein
MTIELIKQNLLGTDIFYIEKNGITQVASGDETDARSKMKQIVKDSKAGHKSKGEVIERVIF